MTPAVLVGCAIGDALGVFAEMKAPSWPPLKEWDGTFQDGGTFRKYNKKGQWSDDTIKSKCIANSLLECNGFNPENIAQKYVDWYNSGEFRGMGSTTSHAILRLKTGATWKESGLVGDEFQGNGSCMSSHQFSVYFRHNIEKLVEAAILDATITHNTKEPKIGSVAVALGVAYILNRLYDPEPTPFQPTDALNYAIEGIQKLGESKVAERLIKVQEHLKMETKPSKALKDIGTRGYVVDTVGAAYYAFCKGTSFKESVVMVIKGGGDADTTGAICGALCGAYYGLEGIPDEYRTVETYDELVELDKKLFEAGKKL